MYTHRTVVPLPSGPRRASETCLVSALGAEEVANKQLNRTAQQRCCRVPVALRAPTRG